MKLTGKAEEDFKEWYKTLEDYFYLDLIPNNMKWGIYLEWADTIGMFIQISLYDYDCMNWQLFIECIDDRDDYTETHLTSRQEAQEKAIEKLNEIYNQKYKP